MRGSATFPGTPIEFYRLSFNPGQDTAQLTKLPVSAEPAWHDAVRAGPVACRGPARGRRPGRGAQAAIQVLRYAHRRRTQLAGAMSTFGPANTAYPRAVSWVRGGTEVAFSWQDSDAPGQCLSAGNADSVRLLNPVVRGGDLVAASELGARVPASLGGCIDGWAQVTGNGRMVIAPVARFNTKTDQNFVAFARLPVDGRGPRQHLPRLALPRQPGLVSVRALGRADRPDRNRRAGARPRRLARPRDLIPDGRLLAPAHSHSPTPRVPRGCRDSAQAGGDMAGPAPRPSSAHPEHRRVRRWRGWPLSGRSWFWGPVPIGAGPLHIELDHGQPRASCLAATPSAITVPG